MKQVHALIAVASAFALSACSENPSHTEFMSEAEQATAIAQAFAAKKSGSLDGNGSVFWDQKSNKGVIFTRAVNADDFEAAKYKKTYESGEVRYILPSAPVVYGGPLSLPKPAYVFDNSSFKPLYTVDPEKNQLCDYKNIQSCQDAGSLANPQLKEQIKLVTDYARKAHQPS